MSANDFPALLGPPSIILWPWRSTPSIRGGDSSGSASQQSARLSGSGRSSFCSSIHSRHSAHEAFPASVATSHCLRPARVTPGILDRRLGFLFWVSTLSPFSRHVE